MTEDQITEVFKKMYDCFKHSILPYNSSNLDIICILHMFLSEIISQQADAASDKIKAVEIVTYTLYNSVKQECINKIFRDLQKSTDIN